MENKDIPLEPILFQKNGEPSHAWLSWHMAVHCVNENKARYDWWEKVRSLPEPPLVTGSGKPNPLWVVWWRSRKNCSNNIALNVCKSKIKGEYIPNKKLHEFLNQKKTQRFLGEA